MINKFSFTIFTFSLLSVYTIKFQTWQFFLVKEKLACQIFLEKENLPTILHLHEQFFLSKVNLSRKNCSCKWGLNSEDLNYMWHVSNILQRQLNIRQKLNWCFKRRLFHAPNTMHKLYLFILSRYTGFFCTVDPNAMRRKSSVVWQFIMASTSTSWPRSKQGLGIWGTTHSIPNNCVLHNYLRRLKWMSHKTNLRRLKYELYSAHEKCDVWTGPKPNKEALEKQTNFMSCYISNHRRTANDIFE